MDHFRKRQFALFWITAPLWVAPSVMAAISSDITIILSEDMQSYFYKESVTCEHAICLYQNSFTQNPIWIIDDKGKPLQATEEGYRLENTTFSVMYKAIAQIPDKSPSHATLSFPLSHVSDLGNAEAVIQQRSVWVVPETATITQYNSPATNPDWEIFNNILKLEASSTPNLHIDVVFNTTTGTSLAAPDSTGSKTLTSRQNVNTNSNTSVENTPIECASVVDIIVKTECEDSGSIVLNGLTFNRNSASLSPSARTMLDRLTQPLKENNTGRFEISAYTDSKGPKRWNLTLSQKRAQTIRQYFIFKGVNPNQLIAIGYGESNPIASNDSIQGRKENRRIELQRHLED